MKKLLFFLFLLLVKIGYTQNWAPIIKNNVSAFISNQGNILTTFVDSITVSNNDSIFHFYKTWDFEPETFWCFKPIGPSWIGASATKKTDNRWIFTNYNGDSLYLRPLAHIDSTWIFYELANGQKVNCRVSELSFETIMGIEDSIKTFTFELINDNGDPILPNPYGDLSIRIGKTLGFVELFPLRHFNVPEHTHHINLQIYNYQIVGISKFGLGKTVINYTDVFNFDVGDEFHYAFTQHWYSHTIERTFTTQTITNKEYQDPNNIKYTIFEKEKYTYTDNTNPDNNLTTITSRTISQIINQNNPEIYIPEKVVLQYEDFGLDGYNQYFFANNRIQLTNNGFGFSYSNTDGCWSPLIPVNKDFYSNGFAEGIGDLGYLSDVSETYRRLELEYYKKGDETWGVPIIISSIGTHQLQNLNLYPNPVRIGGFIYFENSSDNLNVKLTNTSGIIIKQSTLNHNEASFEVPNNIPPGIYFIIVHGQSSYLKVGKVLVTD